MCGFGFELHQSGLVEWSPPKAIESKGEEYVRRDGLGFHSWPSRCSPLELENVVTA